MVEQSYINLQLILLEFNFNFLPFLYLGNNSFYFNKVQFLIFEAKFLKYYFSFQDIELLYFYFHLLFIFKIILISFSKYFPHLYSINFIL